MQMNDVHSIFEWVFYKLGMYLASDTLLGYKMCKAAKKYLLKQRSDIVNKSHKTKKF